MFSFPESTYRLQLHAGFTFQQAIQIVPYLRELGITHVYTSPWLKARPGSTHGYDVIDHETINPEIGSEQDFATWVESLRQHDLEQIVDIVPNHMGVGTNENVWWNDVLENGPASRYAGYFDISWRGSPRPDLYDRVLVPLLGEPYGDALEKGQLRLTFERGAFAVHYYERRFPISPPTYPKILALRPTELERLGDRNEPDLREYRDIIAALDDLPEGCHGGELRRVERFDRQEQLKRRLATLADRSPRVRDHIAQNVARFNGTPGDPDSFDLLDDLLTRQCYRLGYWKIAPDEINYRRFFDVNDLAALSMERPEVFEATHRFILRLLARGALAGLRIDHPDGLYDPKQYFLRLQQAYLEAIEKDNPREAEQDLIAKPPLYVVVEKILAAGEPLPKDWAVHGTTGYDALNIINGLFVKRANENKITGVYDEFNNWHMDFEEVVYQKKLLILDVSLASELQMLTAQLDALALHYRRSRDFTHSALRGALRQVLACFPVYRSYVSDEPVREEDRQYIHHAIDGAIGKDPQTPSAVYEFIRDMLLGTFPRSATDQQRAQQRRFAGKFQQLTAPVTAKGVEDTAFYVYNRLVSLNEVGGDPGRFGISTDGAHAYFKDRQEKWPLGLTPLSTHDTKRGEDVRARINVLSEIPDQWRQLVLRWRQINAPHRRPLASGEAPVANDEYLLYQTLIGAFPQGEPGREEHATFISRIQAYMQKALREAKVHTRWTDPNVDYETGVSEFVARVLDTQTGREFLDDFRPFQARVAHWGRLNSLSQTVLRLTTPGVPDTYQGSELWDLSLVDPDNRRPVDYAHRRAALARLKEEFAEGESRRFELAHALANRMEDGRAKLFVTWQTLEARRRYPGLFSIGEYLPLAAVGSRSEHVFAFMRRLGDRTALVVVPRLVTQLTLTRTDLPLGGGVWQQTRLPLAQGSANRWEHIYTGRVLNPSVDEGRLSLPLSDLLADFPAAVFVSQRA